MDLKLEGRNLSAPDLRARQHWSCEPFGKTDLRSRVPGDARRSGTDYVVGIGGEPINGTKFIECLETFETGPDTESVMRIGKSAAPREQEAAKFVKEK